MQSLALGCQRAARMATDYVHGLKNVDVAIFSFPPKKISRLIKFVCNHQAVKLSANLSGSVVLRRDFSPPATAWPRKPDTKLKA
jgi:hypothetical protein